MSRGNERREIFRDDADRVRFLNTLGSAVDRHNILCHAYCLMDNHYHLLLETPDGNISLAMRHLNGSYAQGFNRRHDRGGHLFQGRFASKLVEKASYLLTVARYIVLNPVRSGQVARPEDWPWSSYRAQIGQLSASRFLTLNWVLSQFDSTDHRAAQLRFARFVESDFVHENPAIDGKPILGSVDFVESFGEPLAAVAPLHEIPRVQRFAARPSLETLLPQRADLQTRARNVHTAHVRHGYKMIEIAHHLGVHPMTVSRDVRRGAAAMLEC
jgi:REP element-mobilizing transposase RayT